MALRGRVEQSRGWTSPKNCRDWRWFNHYFGLYPQQSSATKKQRGEAEEVPVSDRGWLWRTHCFYQVCFSIGTIASPQIVQWRVWESPVLHHKINGAWKKVKTLISKWQVQDWRSNLVISMRRDYICQTLKNTWLNDTRISFWQSNQNLQNIRNADSNLYKVNSGLAL